MPSYKLCRYGTLKPQNWYAFFSEGRRSKSWSTRTTDKVLAHKRAAAFLAELHSPKDQTPEDVGIDAVLRRYEDDKRDDFVSGETNRLVIAHLIGHYGDKPASFITAATNKEYEKDRRKAGQSAATINRTRNTLRAALNHAVRDGQLRYAPHIPTLKVPKGKERWLTYGEAKRLCRTCLGKRWRYLWLFVRIALGTGARHRAILP
jgi:hypothetical protein